VPAEGSGQVSNVHTYEVEVTTGDVRGAGTNADVFLTAFGSKGDSGKVVFKGSGSKFERGQLTKDRFECADLGYITKIRIGNDGFFFFCVAKIFFLMLFF